MKTLLCRVICTAALVGMLFSIFRCRIDIINNYCDTINVGDHIMVDPNHLIGHVEEIRDDGMIKVLVINNIGISKRIILPRDRIHKVIYVIKHSE